MPSLDNANSYSVLAPPKYSEFICKMLLKNCHDLLVKYLQHVKNSSPRVYIYNLDSILNSSVV